MPPELINANTCRTCKWRQSNPESGLEECHEGPPTHFFYIAGVSSNPDGSKQPIIAQHVGFRPVDLTWSCGQHKPKIAGLS